MYTYPESYITTYTYPESYVAKHTRPNAFRPFAMYPSPPTFLSRVPNKKSGPLEIPPLENTYLHLNRIFTPHVSSSGILVD